MLTLESECLWFSLHVPREDLWTPVSYALAKRVGSHVQGSPPLPGMRTDPVYFGAMSLSDMLVRQASRQF